MTRVLILSILAIFMASPAHAYSSEDNEWECSIQKRLQAKGYYRGEIDCIVGPQTRDAILAFQDDMDIQLTGTVGPQTYAKLFGRPMYSDITGSISVRQCSDRDLEVALVKVLKRRGLLD
jgi:hypothetical protein